MSVLVAPGPRQLKHTRHTFLGYRDENFGSFRLENRRTPGCVDGTSLPHTTFCRTPVKCRMGLLRLAIATRASPSLQGEAAEH